MNGTDRYSDAESESSIPEVPTRDQIRECDNGNLLNGRNETEWLTVNQRFSEVNKQITELLVQLFAYSLLETFDLLSTAQSISTIQQISIVKFSNLISR